ncbi:MAG TPA: hypothetical protein ENN18_06090 [Proteobacteria bacterium]|nr:hypothetical protein [Pseudomonadota bacterium]
MSEIDLDQLLIHYREDPYEDFLVETPNTGWVRFMADDGMKVAGPKGTWQHIPGTLLYVLERERNRIPIHAHINGTISDLQVNLNGKFVEANTYLMSIRHPMTKDEVINKILKQVLITFNAPERAKYFFPPEITYKLEKKKHGTVLVRPGEEILIMSLMKRDTPLIYNGEPGIIHTVYFQPNVTVNQGEPLLGICPPGKLNYIRKIVQKIQNEWV